MCPRITRSTPEERRSDRTADVSVIHAVPHVGMRASEPGSVRPLGLAHLTLLTATPPELIEIAAASGYDFVGIRVRPVTTGERAFSMSPGSPMLLESVARAKDLGISVHDIEFLPLTAETTADDWLPVLESGAELGARVLTVAGADADMGRLLDTLAELTADSAEFGIRPALEPISYQHVSRVTVAADLARRTGAAVLLDPLHLQRGGSSMADVAAIEDGLVPILQLCDAPLDPPATPGDRVAGLQQEARAARLPIGAGRLPLSELLSAFPRHVAVSVEIPNAHLQSTMSPFVLARLHAREARALMARTDTPSHLAATTAHRTEMD